MKVLSALLTIACVALTYGLDEPAPVERVVTLLEQLKERLESDGTTEQAAFDKFGCWCETTTSKKAADIVALKQRLQTLGNSILQLKGSLATYAAELAQLAADIEENEKAQATATAIREKEHAAFLAEKSELEQAIAALEGAIKVLKSATSASLRQTKSSLASSNDSPNAILLTKVRSALSHLPSRAGQVHRTQLLSVEQKLAAGNSAGYAPQSATIQGILQEMYESFSSTLQSEIAAEGTLQRNFESLMATYQTELATLKTAVIKKEKQKAEAEVMLAEAETAFDESTEQLAADTDYFDITKASCKAKAEEWSERKTLRAEELQGISEALTILSSDAAKDLFAKAIQPGVGGASTGKMFLQVAESHGHAGGVDTAKKVLKASAKKTQSLRVAAISAEVSALSGKDVGHFEKVFLAIDKLLVQLQEEQAADEEKVATCKEQYVKLNSSLEDLSWKLTNNEANIDKLGLLVEAKTQEKTTVIAEIQNMEAEITSMKEERVAENAEYLAAKKDDEEAIALLEQAKDALAKYFKNNDIELGPLELGRAMLQIEGLEPNETAPEATFSDKVRGICATTPAAPVVKM